MMLPLGPLFLGIDGGGTSTDAWLAGPEGPPLGRGRAGPSNAKAVGLDRARDALDAAIAAAFHDAGLDREPVEVCCLGLAGFDRPEDRAVLEEWRIASRWSQRGRLVNDGDLVLAAGTPQGWGVGLIAGTGSIAVGRSPEGRKARAGGWGHLIGDEGSAYRIVLDALRLVVRRADGREPAPPGDPILSARLCDALGVTEPSRIVLALHAPGMDRTRIASLAPVVMDAAGFDPAVGEGLVREAGNALAEMVVAVARKLGIDRERFPLGIAGGFLLSSPLLVALLVDALDGQGLRVDLARVAEPVAGALRLARETPC